MVSELFPNVAELVDHLCIINSLHGTNAAHGGACLKLHTGSDTFVRPSMGAWVTYGLGTENQNLPGFLTLCPTLAHGGVNNWGAAFLPAVCQGTPLGNARVPADQAKVRYIENTTREALKVLSISTPRRQIERAGAFHFNANSASDDVRDRLSDQLAPGSVIIVATGIKRVR